MEKIPPSRMNILASIAATLGIASPRSTAEILSKHRGRAPRKMKWITGVYIPAGPRRNVQLSKIRNPKVAANVQMMYEKWLSAKLAREQAKQVN